MGLDEGQKKRPVNGSSMYLFKMVAYLKGL